MPKADIVDLFLMMKKLDATDLHLAVNFAPIFRVRKELVEIPNLEPLNAEDIKRMLFTIMNDAQRSLFERKLEHDFSYGIPELGRFRINAFYQSGSVAIAIRRIPFEVPTPQALGVPRIALDLINSPRGLILVTGPTGQGKSTTIASLINELNRTKKYHIITIEDPIEYVFPRGKSFIMQREVGSDTYSFPNALRSALREDPDVIFVGEMRDYETIATTLTAAETGHLVFATLHTNSAAQSIDRIVDVFPPYQQNQVKSQLASVLLAIISQQLIPTADGKGMVLAAEVLIADSAIRSLIRDGRTQEIPNAMLAGRNKGMQTMEEALIDLVAAHKITKEQAEYYAFNRDSLRTLMKSKLTEEAV